MALTPGRAWQTVAMAWAVMPLKPVERPSAQAAEGARTETLA